MKFNRSNLDEMHFFLSFDCLSPLLIGISCCYFVLSVLHRSSRVVYFWFVFLQFDLTGKVFLFYGCECVVMLFAPRVSVGLVQDLLVDMCSNTCHWPIFKSLRDPNQCQFFAYTWKLTQLGRFEYHINLNIQLEISNTVFLKIGIFVCTYYLLFWCQDGKGPRLTRKCRRRRGKQFDVDISWRGEKVARGCKRKRRRRGRGGAPAFKIWIMRSSSRWVCG